MKADGATRAGEAAVAGAGSGSATLKGGGSSSGASAGVASKTAIDYRSDANWPTQTLWSEAS